MIKFLKIVGRFHRWIRIRRKLTLRAYCKKYNIDPSMLSRFEIGMWNLK